MVISCINIFLKPGDIYSSSEPVAIKTVLGSCVSVCIHDPVNKVGGCNHYLLPRPTGEENSPLHYGEIAVPRLIEMVTTEGGNRNYFCAQIVGGSFLPQSNTSTVGEQNIAVARAILKEYAIPIVCEDVGDNFGRVIKYYTHSNKLHIRKVDAPNEEDISPDSRRVNFIKLSNAQFSALQRVLSLSVRQAQVSLSSMLETPLELDIADIMLRKMRYAQEYIRKEFPNFLISIDQKEKAPLGRVVMLMDPCKMELVVNSLLERALNTPLQYERLETSAITEMANIVINAILGSLANQLDFSMMLRAPVLIRSQEKQALLPFMDGYKQCKAGLIVKTNLKIPALGLKTLLLILVELNSLYTFLLKLEKAS